MNTNTRSVPAGLRIARWYLAVVAALLLGVATVTIVGHLSQGAAGTTLVFSQDAMGDEGAIGPAPAIGEEPVAPVGETTGSTQYVDLPSLFLTIAGGAIAAFGAIALLRRSRWAVPFGLAASAVAAGVGLIPAAIGLWAMHYSAMVDFGQTAPFFVMSAGLVVAAVLCGLAVWRSRELTAVV